MVADSTNVPHLQHLNLIIMQNPFRPCLSEISHKTEVGYGKLFEFTRVCWFCDRLGSVPLS